ncbi:hypothetical protein QFZ20_002875 [Flavobacterium sp. W4I14]|nr:hypothetical protein [Flavobacterium sp. W4I14]
MECWYCFPKNKKPSISSVNHDAGCTSSILYEVNMDDFLERNAVRFLYVSPALRFIPMKYRGCRFDQGYGLGVVARKPI